MNPLTPIGPNLGNNANVGVTQVIVMNDRALTRTQLIEMETLFAAHKQQLPFALGGYLAREMKLRDGSRLRITSNSGMHSLMVWPEGGGVYVGEPPPLWILISITLSNATLIGGVAGEDDADVHYEQAVYSRVYKMPRNLQPGGATLYYDGKTESEVDEIRLPLFSSPFYYVSSAVSTLADTRGAIGAATAFAPYGEEALLFGQKSTIDRTASDSGNSYQLTERTGQLHLDGTTVTLDSQHEFQLIAFAQSASRSGERMAKYPVPLEDGFTNYVVAELAGTFGDGMTDSPRYDRFNMLVPGAGTDAAGAPPSVLTAGASAYTRREVGYWEQSPGGIFTRAAPWQLRDRAYNFKTSATTTTPVWYTENLLLKMVAGTITEHKLAIVDYMDVERLQIDLALLPDMDTWDGYADLLAGLSTANNTATGVAAAFQECGYGAEQAALPYTPRAFAWIGNSQNIYAAQGYTLGPSYTLQVTCLPDQQSAWRTA